MLRRSSGGAVPPRLGGSPSEFIRLLSTGGCNGAPGAAALFLGDAAAPRLLTPRPGAYSS